MNAVVQPKNKTTLLERARTLRPLIDKFGPAHEAQGELAPEVVQALHDGDFFGMWVPKSLGGYETDPVEALEVLEEISYAHGSTGWVLMATALSTGTAGAFVSDDYAKKVFSFGRFPVVGGQGSPGGKAVATKGGFILSGDWNYGSGVKHADFIHTGAVIYEADGKPRTGKNGMPEIRVFVVPRADFTYGANWDVLGLRATGSIDYSCRDVFVPEGGSHITDANVPLRGGSLFRLGIRGLSTICHIGFTLGVARRTLDEIALIAQTKQSRLGNLADNPSFLEDYGTAEAKVRSIRALIFETFGDIETTLKAGGEPSTRQWTLARLCLNHVTWSMAEVTSFAFYAGGGTSLREGPLQRCFRDMHAATQHLTSSPKIRADCARELAGLAKGKVWGFMGLADPA